MSQRQVTIYSAARPEIAHLLKNLLSEQGIEALLINEPLQNALGDLPLGAATDVKVVVDEQAAEEARAIAESFDRRLAHHTPETMTALLDSADARDELNVWPTCPGCHRKRTAVCPHCGTAGSDFPAADSSGETEPAWICPTCDEPLRLSMLRRCEWCGHDFGEGVEVQPEEVMAAYDRRIFLLLAAVAATFGALMFYFYQLLQE